MSLFSLIHLTLHILWKKELKMYFQKVIFKNELKREIYLRFLSKNFIFPLDQISEFYFSRKQKRNQNVELNSVEGEREFKEDNKEGNQYCVICYEDSPNILFEPCNHGAICQ